MKLHDCSCGGIPQVSYKINEHFDFGIHCTNCDKRTPKCSSLREAVSLWNYVYCCSLPPYQLELV